jgi:Phage regulatory protein CII (CP76)
MTSHESILRAIGTRAVDFAKRLRLSTRLVYRWMEPSVDYTDSGALNPVDRIEHIVETSLALGRPVEDAHAPIIYLEERFGRVSFMLPAVSTCAGEVSQELLKTVKEFGELAEVASKALDDGRITRREFEAINSAGWELIRQTAAFVKKAEASVR